MTNPERKNQPTILTLTPKEKKEFLIILDGVQKNQRVAEGYADMLKDISQKIMETSGNKEGESFMLTLTPEDKNQFLIFLSGGLLNQNTPKKDADFLKSIFKKIMGFDYPILRRDNE